MNLNFTLTGIKGVLVRLDKLKSNTVTSSGVIVNSYENYETEGGRPSTKLSHEVFSLRGTVLKMSAAAMKAIEQEGYKLDVSDTIIVYPSAKSPQNWFIDPDKIDEPTSDFEGYLLLHPAQIQCILNTKNEKSE